MRLYIRYRLYRQRRNPRQGLDRLLRYYYCPSKEEHIYILKENLSKIF
jgi:hypothetical protein